MEPYQRATIIMQEYSTLRNEILALSTGVTQATVALISVLLALVTYGLLHHFTATISWLIIWSCIVYLVTQSWLWFWMFNLSAHLRRIEQRINDIAGGDPLLTWETIHNRGGIISRCLGWR
jgi:ammonia channel protein AmtB